MAPLKRTPLGSGSADHRKGKKPVCNHEKNLIKKPVTPSRQLVGLCLLFILGLAVAACDSTAGPDSARLEVVVVVEPEQARFQEDTVTITVMLYNRRDDPFVITGFAKELRYAETSEARIDSSYSTVPFEISAQDSMRYVSETGLFAVFREPARYTYEFTFVGEGGLSVAGRDTFEVVP